ncbi:hypothetical protein EV141_0454 [Microcella putealis]|uniref:Methyltransferase n=1 Tax=Microcella putealis TaxID=337005 RepID=A0A4Q7LW54_9MICO|nr:methyltransferase [Microcella putealis]RZS59236.1 hypothetical protein EV141_0454 [Microcella putealis]HET8958472.1 methyltransferase [Microcella sp.]
MTDTTKDYDQTWVAVAESGAVGSILRDGDDYSVRLRDEDALRGPFDSLEAAKSALTALLGPGADRPDFREH